MRPELNAEPVFPSTIVFRHPFSAAAQAAASPAPPPPTTTRSASRFLAVTATPPSPDRLVSDRLSLIAADAGECITVPHPSLSVSEVDPAAIPKAIPIFGRAVAARHLLLLIRWRRMHLLSISPGRPFPQWRAILRLRCRNLRLQRGTPSALHWARCGRTNCAPLSRFSASSPACGRCPDRSQPEVVREMAVKSTAQTIGATHLSWRKSHLWGISTARNLRRSSAGIGEFTAARRKFSPRAWKPMRWPRRFSRKSPMSKPETEDFRRPRSCGSTPTLRPSAKSN